MTDFLVGVALVLVIEGLLFAAIPEWMRVSMARAVSMPDIYLRAIGITSAIIGLIAVWLLRG